MQKKWIYTISAGLLAIAAVGGLAHAGMGGSWGGGFGRGLGMMGPGALMERYDTNKDGKITQAEIDQNRTQWLAEFDADKNGALSLDEFKNLWLKARNEQMVREFQEFDRDGNAQVTLDEYKAPFAQIVAARDRTGDGALSRDDMMGPGGPGRHWRRGAEQGDGQGGDGQ